MSVNDAPHERITVRATSTSGGQTYDVLVGPGLIDVAGELIASTIDAHLFAVITDSQVSDIYGARLMKSLERAGLDSTLFKFPAGEWNKNREIWAQVTDDLLRAGLGRDAAVIALGGGVAGDLGGFVAATFLRGIPVIQIPTSLLAMVDSSVGGKTGVDTSLGKNLVGAFHQPSLVLIDPGVLSTLPVHQLAAGLAEALKHGLILDAEYFDATLARLKRIFERDVDALTHLVSRSVSLKAGVVEQDSEEVGFRAILNFGHTVGHALEAVSGYELLHGEAVAVGMAMEARIGERLGLTAAGASERVEEALTAARLPIDIDEDLRREDFFKALALDKKRQAGHIRYTFLADVGRIAGSADDGWTHEVPDEIVAEVLFS